jgi:hypothetical protein
MATGNDIAAERLRDARQSVSPQQRMALAVRIHQTIEREMDAIERILSTIKPANPSEAELAARTVAGVSRALREIRALNAPEDEMPPDDPNEDAVPRDIDAFVRRLRNVWKNLSKLSAPARARGLLLMASLCGPCELDRILRDFFTRARDHQLPPDRAGSGAEWTTWLILGGRGAGKTRAGAEWVRRVAADDHTAMIALVGETEHDAREVMVEGISGVLAVHPPDEHPQWIPTRRRLEWKNGAVAQVFSAEDPEQLRGPQFSAAWCDEFAKWRHADEAVPINRWRAPRAALEAFATLQGFEG